MYVLERNKINNLTHERLVEIQKYFCTNSRHIPSGDNRRFKRNTKFSINCIYDTYEQKQPAILFLKFSKFNVTFVTKQPLSFSYFAVVNQLKEIVYENQR